MTPADDDQWLAALGRREAEDSPAAREALALRSAVLQLSDTREAVTAPARDGVRETNLIARARGEGLLPTPKRAPWRLSWEWSAGFAAAALAAVAIGIGLYLNLGVEPEPVIRATPDGIVRISAPDPELLKQELVEELRAAGVSATGYELLGRHGVDADLPQPLTDAVLRVLEKHQIP